jgi:signal transduction histidine kinase
MAGIHDPDRLAALRRLPLLDGDEPALDRAVRLAARILDTPTARVTLVDGDREALQDLASMAMMAIGLRRQALEQQHLPAEPAADPNVQRSVNEPEAKRDEATRASLSMLRHEFGQPLTVIQGFSELICDGDMSPEEIKEYAAEIFKEATHLAEMFARTRDL